MTPSGRHVGRRPGGAHSREYRVLIARLRETRENLGLNQVDVANLLKRPQSFVSKTESGERRLDPIDLARFARIYGKPVDYFIPKID